MKYNLILLFVGVLFESCSDQSTSNHSTSNHSTPEIEGTWKLLSAKTIINNDTTVVLYSDGVSGIKIINQSHFAFFQHDLNQGRDSSRAKFSSGGGKYTLEGNDYTEFLEYCSGRGWENNKFDFTIEVKNDSLIQTGVEKVPALGVDRIIIETYVRTNDSNTPIPVNSTFDAEELSWFKNKGEGTIAGSAKFKSKGGQILFGNEFRIELMPSTSYTKERLNRIYKNNESGYVHIEDGIQKFIPDPDGYHETIKTRCNKAGEFEFENLPAGDYYVIAFMLKEQTGGGIMQHVVLTEKESETIAMTNF